MNQGEIIIYKPDGQVSIQIEVTVDGDTVWLTQSQMSELFQTTRNNITLHISNIFKEGELLMHSVCKDSLHTAPDGKKYKTKYYSLDVIISVGYRVKSIQGTRFRIWANSVLKDYLLRGYAVHQRLERIEEKVFEHEQRFDVLVKSSLPLHEGIFYDGQIFDVWQFVSGLIKSARSSIILINNYIDESVLLLLSKCDATVSTKIYTQNISKQLLLDLQKLHAQYPPVELVEFTRSHDRFLILDNSTVYHIGASLKDMGKKWFAFSKMEIDALELIEKINSMCH